MSDATREVKADDILEFTRSKKLTMLRHLSAGGYGETVLLRDESIGLNFVCKKFAPDRPGNEDEDYRRFKREAKLLYRVLHPNVVRCYMHYFYDAQRRGYILMEHIEGGNVKDYLVSNPEAADAVFRQMVDGFCHLEGVGILHRDIRNENIMVTHDGQVKIIDLGFGKANPERGDFHRSVTLNIPYSTPTDFHDQQYTWSTEVYCVGKVIKGIIDEHSIAFSYPNLLEDMCLASPVRRPESFTHVRKKLEESEANTFTKEERAAFQLFELELRLYLYQLPWDAADHYQHDVSKVIAGLQKVYEANTLLSHVGDPATLLNHFTSSAKHVRQDSNISTSKLGKLLTLWKQMPPRKQQTLLTNIHSVLDSIPRMQEPDDIPF